MIRRREFITLLGGAAAWPLAARAQQALPVVGFLSSQSPEAFAPYVSGFRDGLKEAGFIEGKNVAIEYRWSRGRNDALPSLAVELAALRPAVIVTSGGQPVALAAKAASSTPIVFLTGGDPVRQGLADSFNRPGGNATGVTQLTLTLDPKRLGLLRELVPQSNSVAFLSNPNFPGAEERQQRLHDSARAIGLELVVLHAGNEAAIDEALSNIDRERISALLVGGDPFFNSRRDKIVTLVARKGIPAIYEWREFASAGGLMSYGTSLADAYRQTGLYAGRILKGEKPAEMPILQPTKFELVINLKTVRMLGLTIPPGLLAIADEVIE
jgi:putative ABC transport system substrate-binding protein